jgi:hypothetical protein
MKVKGTLRLRSQPDNVVAVTLETLPSRLVVHTGHSVIGDWSAGDVVLRTDGDHLVAEAEGEVLVLDVPNRYQVIETFRATTGPTTPVSLAERVGRGSSATRPIWQVALGSGLGALSLIAGGWLAWASLVSDRTGVQPENLAAPVTTTTARPETTRIVTAPPLTGFRNGWGQFRRAKSRHEVVRLP